jgi:hypothetical protein
MHRPYAALCQYWMHMRLAYLIVGCLPVLGQTSTVSSVTKAPGEKVTLDIRMDSQPATVPVALKWEVVFPAQLMEMEGDAPETGSAAMESGKALQCTAQKPYSYVCILSGGQNPIASGPLAIFRECSLAARAYAKVVGMVWALPWRKKRLRVRVPLYISGASLMGGAVVLWARWSYIHPTNPAIGSALSLMADFVPMAIAVVGIVMSYRTPKKEHHLRTTLILFACGFVGTGIMSLARIRGEAAHKAEIDGLNAKLQSVADQNGKILKGITEPKSAPPPMVTHTPQPTEAGRRNNVLVLLHNEYILSHDKVSPGLIASIEPLPSEWVNNRLRELAGCGKNQAGGLIPWPSW